MIQRSFQLCAIFSATLLIGLAGCDSKQGGAGAANSTAPKVADFGSTLASVESMTTKICKAFVEGKPDDAHDVLHDVGHALEQLPILAAKEGKFSAEQLTTINQSVEAMFDGFGKLDDSMHGGGTVDAKELETKLTEALTKLKETVK